MDSTFQPSFVACNSGGKVIKYVATKHALKQSPPYMSAKNMLYEIYQEQCPLMISKDAELLHILSGTTRHQKWEEIANMKSKKDCGKTVGRWKKIQIFLSLKLIKQNNVRWRRRRHGLKISLLIKKFCVIQIKLSCVRYHLYNECLEHVSTIKYK